MSGSRRRSLIPDFLMRLFRPPGDAEAPSPPVPLSSRNPPMTGKDKAADRSSANLSPDKPKEILTSEERARRVIQANRAYFKAEGMMDAFYLAYPSERPPGHLTEADRAEQAVRRQSSRHGRGGR